MKARYAFYSVMSAALAFSVVSCSKKETTETAPAAPAAAPATPIDMATAASVSGTVNLEGAAPKRRRINMAAEPSCAAQHPTPATDEEVVTGKGGALEYVVVYVKKGLDNRTFETPKTPVTLDQKGCMYVPHVLALQTGQPLEVRNDDKITHNIHPMPKFNPE